MGYEFLGEKIVISFAPVPGIDNDQSLRIIFDETFPIPGCRLN